jgi:thiamine pyrophosphokinase
MSTSTVIVTGGDRVPADPAPPLPTDAFVIAADSGLHSAQELGLAVDLVVGDFDSADTDAVAAARAAGTAIERHPVDKDATDLELALEAAIARGLAPAIVLCGASFDRIDHFMANALLLASPRFAPLRPQWWVKGAHVVPVHDQVDLSGAPGDTVTLLAVGGPAEGITTAGLRWPLADEMLPAGSTRGVSNVMTSERAAVHLRGGTLLAIHHGGRP